MQTQRLLATMRGWNYKRGLALCFLAFVFTIGAATYPQSLVSLGEAMQRQTFSLRNFAQPLNSMYRGMLDFESPMLTDRGTYINLNGLMARLMGQRFVNERVKLDNGHLTELIGRIDTEKACRQITEMHCRQAAAGNAFLFVMAPSQLSGDEAILPAGYEDYSNANSDALLSGLRESGVSVLDLREEMRADGLRHDEAFFVTDHHWKPETGFWAYARIVAELTGKGIIPPIDPMYTDLSSYRVDVYKDWYLGSHGRRTGRFFAGMDDISAIMPRFDTYLTAEAPASKQTWEGPFSQAAFDWSRMEKRGGFLDDPYLAYDCGMPPVLQYRNTQAPIAQKVLRLGDSFGNAVTPFLALTFQAVDEVDNRLFPGDFVAFYEQCQPDIVILLVHAALPESGMKACYFFPEQERAAPVQP